MQLDLSSSGIVELFYDGARKHHELFVEHPTPIPYRVSLQTRDAADADADGAAAILLGFAAWVPMLQQLAVPRGDDPAVDYLKAYLSGPRSSIAPSA